jgi:hypothetical protein
MPLSWNDIRTNAVAFSHEWKDEESEDAEAKSFVDGFFKVFGISRRRIATFETRVKKIDGKDGYIDLLWKGVLLIEFKSRGKSLDRAYKQATGYFPGLKDYELPKYVTVCDFASVRLYDLDNGTDQEFPLSDLYKHIKLFGFIAGYQVAPIKPEDPANIKAAELMGKLHDQLKATGYTGHALEVYLVRLLFCLFADYTSIFERNQFREYITLKTADDGRDLGHHLATLFHVLNTPTEKRLKSFDEHLTAFPHVNGKLFEEVLPPAGFDSKTRKALLAAASLNWSLISPAIFGSLFQSVMKPKERRSLGAHYTTEQNILKVIRPLFLDDLRAEFERAKSSKSRLAALHQRLAKLKFFDPACGCGNFLVISYRELRLLELDILRIVQGGKGPVLDVAALVLLDVDQFYGIEIEEFPAQIAQVALWMVDHQMNMLVSDEFGKYFRRLPLKKSPKIVNGNALTIPWSSLVPVDDLFCILGNPPFIGHHLQSQTQKAELRAVYGANAKSAGVMDFVSAWFVRAAAFIAKSQVKVGFVATNSITQGEQVGIMWRALRQYGLHIHFAHRTFKWMSEARGKAAVYCVIIGFSAYEDGTKRLFEYDAVDGEPHEMTVSQINAYLVDAPWVLLENRSRNLFGMPEMMYGSKPTDGGHFLFTDEEKKAFLKKEPAASKLVKPFISAHEYLHGENRWVLWLTEAKPADLKLPEIHKRVNAVAMFRKASKAPSTRNYPYPTLFRQVTQPKTDYVLVPGHTSENRTFVPFSLFDKEHIVGNSCFALPGASLFHFGVIQSMMHMAWVRAVCGRLESRYRYSKDIVYNNFPWPSDSISAVKKISVAAQGVIDARAKFPGSTLSDLYDPIAMPVGLRKAHKALDNAVDSAYRRSAFKSETERVAFLFGLYKESSAPLAPTKAPKQDKRPAAPKPVSARRRRLPSLRAVV